MNILDFFKIGKIALADKSTIEQLVTQAKKLEGPTPSWKTGEFWLNQVLPSAVLIFSGLSGLIPATWFVGGLLVLALVGYVARTALKMVHVWAAKGAGALIDPSTITDIQGTVTTIASAVSALKDATKGNLDGAKTVTETLNAPVTVNVDASTPTK